jgi:hypothetical protein
MSDPVVMVLCMRLPLFHKQSRRDTTALEESGHDEVYAGMAAISAEIEEAGWTTVAIDSADVAPPWAYTVGMWITHRGADLAMFGVPADLARDVFGVLGERMADGWMPAPGDVIDDLGRRPLKLCRIHVSWRETSLFAFNDMCHGIVRPPMLQVVWPDSGGRFPGEARGPVRARACDIQPMCWLPTEDNPPGPWAQLRESG